MKRVLYEVWRLCGFGKRGADPFLECEIEQILYFKFYLRCGGLRVRWQRTIRLNRSCRDRDRHAILRCGAIELGKGANGLLNNAQSLDRKSVV